MLDCCGDASADAVNCCATFWGCGPCVWGAAQRRLTGGGWAAAVGWTTLATMLGLVPALVYVVGIIVYRVQLNDIVNRISASAVTAADERAINSYVIFVYSLLAILCVFGITMTVVAVHRRGKLRAALGLPGSCAGDCLRWIFCGSCSLCQEARTLRNAPMKDGVLGKSPTGARDATMGAPASQAMDRV